MGSGEDIRFRLIGIRSEVCSEFDEIDCRCKSKQARQICRFVLFSHLLNCIKKKTKNKKQKTKNKKQKTKNKKQKTKNKKQKKKLSWIPPTSSKSFSNKDEVFFKPEIREWYSTRVFCLFTKIGSQISL